MDSGGLIIHNPTSDQIVRDVIKKFNERSLLGIKKYGTTVADNPLNLASWLTHLQEELMDAVVYLEKAKASL